MTDRSDPLNEYIRRLAQRQGILARLSWWEGAIANMRLCVFIAGAVVIWVALGRHQISPVWIGAPVLAFLALVIIHERVLRAMGRAKNGVDYYTRGVARIEGRWMGTGWDGAELAPKDHPYAADLDLFGPASLFQLLCTVQTRAGGKILADWLCAPAPADEIPGRQAAIEELRNRIDLREELAYHGQNMKKQVFPEMINAWAAQPAVFCSRILPWAAYAVTIAVLLCGAAWYFRWASLPLDFSVLALIGIHAATRRGVHAVISSVDEPRRELEVTRHVLARLEQEPFEHPYLRALKASFTEGAQPASRAIGRLMTLLTRQDASLNMLFGPVGAVLFWNYHCARAIDTWRRRHAAAIPRWLESVGRLEALCALAAYAYEHPEDPFPAIEKEGPVFIGEGLGHPLLVSGQCVRNDVVLDVGHRLLIVSGSNMSGKTVLLRTVGINAVLAAAGAPVRARALRLSPLKIGATLNVHDALQDGVSRFYAEIKRIRALMDIAHGPVPLLFLLDEIFHGTNSFDRRIGAHAVLRNFWEAGAIGLVTTHDLAITELADGFNGQAANFHFQDHLEDSQLVFDYRLHPGVVTRSNALDLMRAIGLRVE